MLLQFQVGSVPKLLHPGIWTGWTSPRLWPGLFFTSAGVFPYAGIKIPQIALFAHDSGLRPKESPWDMLLAIGITAFLCIAIGVSPDPR